MNLCVISFFLKNVPYQVVVRTKMTSLG